MNSNLENERKEWPITLHITEADIVAAQKDMTPRSNRSLPDSPALIAIERSTGSKWVAHGIAILKEEKSPYRVILLSWQLRHATRNFFIYGSMEPCSAEVWLTL
jgi:hypothetical protein